MPAEEVQVPARAFLSSVSSPFLNDSFENGEQRLHRPVQSLYTAWASRLTWSQLPILLSLAPSNALFVWHNTIDLSEEFCAHRSMWIAAAGWLHHCITTGFCFSREHTDCLCVMLPCVATTPLLLLAAAYLVGLQHMVTKKGFLNFEESTCDEGKFATCGGKKATLTQRQ